MAKNALTNKLEKIMRFWSDYLPEEGVSMFQKDINEIIELSKKYKKGGS